MRKLLWLAIVPSTAALTALAGCMSGSSTEAAAPSTTTSGAMSEVQILALAKEVAQCIRNNGLPGFPDPYFENGQLELPPVDANVEQQGQALLEGACRDSWQRLEAALPEQKQDAQPKEEQRRPMTAEDLEKLKQFTECMRANGFATWPDPDETGTYHLGGAGLPAGLGKGERPEDATFRTALEACHQFEVPGMGFTN
jgi:hypothetical protein